MSCDDYDLLPKSEVCHRKRQKISLQMIIFPALYKNQLHFNRVVRRVFFVCFFNMHTHDQTIKVEVQRFFF